MNPIVLVLVLVLVLETKRRRIEDEDENDEEDEGAGSWKASFRFFACSGTMNQIGTPLPALSPQGGRGWPKAGRGAVHGNRGKKSGRFHKRFAGHLRNSWLEDKFKQPPAGLNPLRMEACRKEGRSLRLLLKA